MRGPLSFPARVIMLMEANLRSLASHRSRQRLIAPICSTADMRQAVMKFRKTAYLDGVKRCVCVCCYSLDMGILTKTFSGTTV